MASITLVVCALFAGWRHGVAERRATSALAAPTHTPASPSVIREALPLASKPDHSPSAPPAAAGESRPAADPLERVLPHEQPLQRLAFTRYRLAWLEGEHLSVRRSGDMQEVARVSAPGAQNVVAMVGGGFLVLGRDRVLRLSGTDKRAERFARAPRLGPTTLLASSQNAEQFWLYYEGIPRLPMFDLASEPRGDPAAGVGPSLPALGFIELSDFDRRALLHFGDGSMVYTSETGLARIDAEGHRQRLPLPELAGKVWRLARAVRWDQVWAATQQHLYRIEARPPARIIDRIELPPHPLALTSAGRDLALLSIESVSDDSAALRVDVYTLRAEGLIHRRVLRFEDHPARADAGAPALFLPELALAPGAEVVAAAGFGLHIYDWGTGQELYPRREVGVPGRVNTVSTQNLAPTAP